MHGRVVVGLLAHVIEQRHGGDDFVPARLTVDMFRLPDVMTPVEVKTKLVRDGLRIRVIEADFFSGGVPHGARLRPVVAQDGKSGRAGMVAAELGRAEAVGDSGADRSAARHERQMDHPADHGPRWARSASAGSG